MGIALVMCKAIRIALALVISIALRIKMRFVSSRYNIPIHINNSSVYLYNTYSGAFAKLERQVYDKITISSFERHDVAHFDRLLSEGFIVLEESNEYNKIVIESKKDSYGDLSRELSIVIAPTLLCNLQCVYCFEKKNTQIIMDKNTQDTVAEFILKKLTPETKNVKINWFGGEPMLAFDAICHVSKLLKEELSKLNISFTPTMITNGILLDEEKCSILKNDCNLTHVQITIDGNEVEYCKIKKASASQFRALMNNIKSAVNFFPVSVRLNGTKNNFDDLKNITKQLYFDCNHNSNLKFYLARVVDYDNKMNKEYYSLNEYLNKKIEFDNFLSKLMNLQNCLEIPHYRRNYCGALKLNNVVIGPEGELYKCEHFIGQKNKVIGNIFDGYFYNDQFTKFTENKFRKKCKSCVLFPQCLGGCPVQRATL